MTSTQNTSFIHRARGTLLGLAVGDAIGTIVGFKPRCSFVPLTDMVGGGPFGLAPGQFTDDYSSENNPFGWPSKTTTQPGLLACHPAMEWTGGGLVSNALDLARWGAALFGERAMPGPYLEQLLQAVPVGADAPGVFYGSGVAIDRSGPHGDILGHGGWIPGYVSSLRHAARHGVTVAFQVNTDIGMLTGDSPVVRRMEQRLLGTVLSRPVPTDCAR